MEHMYSKALEKLLSSRKYSDVCCDTVRRILAESFARHRKPKDAEKAARERLHAITGAFMSEKQLRDARALLNGWTPGDDELLEHALSLHASTRERLPLKSLDALYSRVFDITGKPNRILDLACGLNPVYLGARGFAVEGMDIHGGAMRLIDEWAKKNALDVRANVGDLLVDGSIPKERFSLALMMKLLPVLEGQRAGAAAEALLKISADYTLVSFPTRTLGGRGVGMERNYTNWMESNLSKERAVVGRFVEGSELIYVLKEV